MWTGLQSPTTRLLTTTSIEMQFFKMFVFCLAVCGTVFGAAVPGFFLTISLLRRTSIGCPACASSRLLFFEMSLHCTNYCEQAPIWLGKEVTWWATECWWTLQDFASPGSGDAFPTPGPSPTLVLEMMWTLAMTTKICKNYWTILVRIIIHVSPSAYIQIWYLWSFINPSVGLMWSR